VALEELGRHLAPMPVLGVIEPGAAAGCATTRSGHIGVLGTEGTVRGGAYQRAIARILPNARVAAVACSLFVALAEEGWTDGPIVEAVARRYLEALFEQDPLVDTLLLGCTHFPVLAGVLQSVAGQSMAIVDSALTTAEAVATGLCERGLLQSRQERGAVRLIASDGRERFARVGSNFLGEPFSAAQVELVDVGPSSGSS
jgi:glutamate racemase